MHYHLKRFLTFLVVFFPVVTMAWNPLGHKVIAQIAYEHLKPNTKSQVDNLIAAFHKEYPQINSLADISIWPDELRKQKIETFTHWHYIDIALTQDNSPLKNLMDTDNAVWAITHIIPIVQNKKANEYERARFLAFLTHITSDLHQPLHTVSLISAAHPNGDRGGNDFSVRYQNKTMRLHALWDSGVGEFGQSASNDHVKVLAREITTAYPEQVLNQQLAHLNPTDWVNEGMEIAKQYVYNIKENDVVSNAYIRAGQSSAEREAALAGYRLAALLNELLK